MNTEVYSWQTERMVALEMENFRREIDSIRLTHDAGLSNPGLLERMAIAVGGALERLGKQLNQKFTDPHQAYQVTSSKYAA